MEIALGDGEVVPAAPPGTPVAPTPPTPREQIRAQLKGTHDIARAAELLMAEGSISYWQNPDPNLQDDVAGSFGQAENDLEPTKINCHDFVHLCNHISCCREHTHHIGETWGALFDLREDYTKWDGKSEIPRGSVIIAMSPIGGDSASGIFHVGVSTGGGNCISNTRDDNVNQDTLQGTFGMPAYQVYYGGYPHCPCHDHDGQQPTKPLRDPPGAWRRFTPSLKAVAGAGLAVVTLGGLGTAVFEYFSHGSAQVTSVPRPSALPPSAPAGAVAKPIEAPPQDVSMTAFLAPPETIFTVDARDSDGDPLTFTWTGAIGCGTFKPPVAQPSQQRRTAPQESRAGWFHENAPPPPPDLSKSDPDGDGIPDFCPHTNTPNFSHPGKITVLISDGNGGDAYCTYEGSLTGTGVCQPGKP